jgi:hypothetical protein
LPKLLREISVWLEAACAIVNDIAAKANIAASE